MSLPPGPPTYTVQQANTATLTSRPVYAAYGPANLYEEPQYNQTTTVQTNYDNNIRIFIPEDILPDTAYGQIKYLYIWYSSTPPIPPTPPTPGPNYRINMQVMRAYWLSGFVGSIVSDTNAPPQTNKTALNALILVLQSMITNLQSGAIGPDHAQITINRYMSTYLTSASYLSLQDFIANLTYFTNVSGGTPSIWY